MILDLRNNPGGAEYPLRRAARMFFPKRERLGQIVTRNGKVRNLNTLPRFIGLDGPRIEEAGVIPNVIVPLALAALRSRHDAAVEAALAPLNGRH